MSDPEQLERPKRVISLEEIETLLISDFEHRIKQAEIWGLKDARDHILVMARRWVLDQENQQRERMIAAEDKPVNGHNLNKVRDEDDGEEADETDDLG